MFDRVLNKPLPHDECPYNIETSSLQSKSVDWFLYDGTFVMKELKMLF